MRRQRVSGRCASSIRSPPSRKTSSPTSWRRSAAARLAERDLRNIFVAAWARPADQRNHQARRAGDHQRQEAHRAADGPRAAGPHQAVLQLGDRSARLRPDRVTVRPAEPRQDHRRVAVAQPPPQRRRTVRVLASHRADEIPGRSALSHAAAHRAAAERSRAASWPEVHGDTIIIPAARMKGKKARRANIWCRCRRRRRRSSHRCRASGRAVPVLVQRGQAPLTMTGPIKRDLDRRMLRTLKAMARRRGEDHHAVKLPHWTNHDLRRTVRSGLSELRVPHNVAEAVLAHRPPGIVGTYDVHEYLDEKREALEAWAQQHCGHRQPGARQGHQAAEAAAMIKPRSSPTPMSSGIDQDRRARCAWPRCRPDRASDHADLGTSAVTAELRSRSRRRQSVIFRSADQPRSDRSRSN